MSTRAAAWLAWSLAALSVAMLVGVVVLDALVRSALTFNDWFTIGSVSDAVISILFLAFPLVGALIASRRPQNPIGWICLADGLLWMVLAVTDSYSVYGTASPGSVPFPVAIGTLGNQWLWVPTVGLLGIYLVLLFPDGKLPSKRWRPLTLFSAVVIMVYSVTEGLAPGPLENPGGVRNPFGLEALPWLVGVTYILLPLLPLCIFASAVSMVLRYRRSSGEVREQIKWIAFGLLRRPVVSDQHDHPVGRRLDERWQRTSNSLVVRASLLGDGAWFHRGACRHRLCRLALPSTI